MVQQVILLHNSLTVQWHENASYKPIIKESWLELVAEQHGYNFDLWHEEDNAREPGALDAVVAQTKRTIDALNQKRNDTITQLDIVLNESVFKATKDCLALPFNSETVGSIVDRLSIASLKEFHMQEQLQRSDVSHQHIQSCAGALHSLQTQKKDLATSLQILCDDIANQRKYNKIYQQFKMYNDPNLNPKIYKSK